MRSMIVMLAALVGVAGCGPKPAAYLRVTRAVNPIATDASFDTAGWEKSHPLNLQEDQQSHGRISAMWDEKYLYLWVQYVDSRVDPASMRLWLGFPTDQGEDAFGIWVTSDGKCLDPSFAAGPRPMPPERASCGTSWDGRCWEARVRLTLTFVRAIGNKVGIAAKLNGAFTKRPKPDLPMFFTETASGTMHFAY